jgi:hypothetical protein
MRPLGVAAIDWHCCSLGSTNMHTLINCFQIQCSQS